MLAGRTGTRRFESLVHIAAVLTTPLHRLVALEHAVVLDVGQQPQIPPLVLLLGDADRLEGLGHRFEALFAGDPGELGVNLGPLLVLAAGGGLVGLEFAHCFEGLGSDVTVVQAVVGTQVSMALRNAVTLTGANDAVRTILEVANFGQLFRIT